MQKVLLSILVSTVITSSLILLVDFSTCCLSFLVSFAFVHFFLLGEASSATSEKDRYFRVRGV